MALSFNPKSFGVQQYTPAIKVGDDDPFVRFPAQIEEMNQEAKSNKQLDRALRLPYSVAETIFLGTLHTAIMIKGNLAVLVHGPAGLGKSRMGLGMWQLFIKELWQLQGFRYDLPEFAFNYAQSSDAIGSIEKKGITIFQDERTYMSGHDSLAKINALLNQLMVTARDMRKVFICCGIKEMKDLNWHLRFELIGMGQGIGVNEALMSGPTGYPIGKILLPICTDDIYDAYYPLKLENEKRLAAQGGFDDAHIDGESVKRDYMKVYNYAKEQGYFPSSEKKWMALLPEAGVFGTTYYQSLVITRLMMDMEAGKVEGANLSTEGEHAYNAGTEVPIYELPIGEGFQYDYWEELQTLFNDPLVGITAQMYYDQQVNNMKFDQLVEKYKLSLGSIHSHVGKSNNGKPSDKLLKVLGKINLNLSAKHEDYAQLKWEDWGFERIYMEGEPRNAAVAPPSFPDRVMKKKDAVVFVSCKSSAVDRDVPVYRNEHAGHTGMDPEIDWYQKYNSETRKYIALEFVNHHHPTHHRRRYRG